MEAAIYIPEIITISDQEYQSISRLIYDRFGIHLGDQKKSLIVGRLQKELKTRGFSSFQEYYECVMNDTDGSVLSSLINKVSTNHTYFNRESAHFDYLASYALPEITANIHQRDAQTIRIWSAGCSSGEEPYILSMILKDFMKNESRHREFGILATDISEKALLIARQGIYQYENVMRLPQNLRDRYFKKNADNTLEVVAEIKRQVLFRRLNLMRPVFPFKNKFHVIFCRNVMIYFDGATRESLLQRFHYNMETGGYLFLGHSESIGRNNSNFRYIKPAVYQKIG